METIDRRKVNEDGEARQIEPEEHYDDFRPTVAGFQPLNDAVLLRELKLPEDGLIQTPDAFAEPCLYCEVVLKQARSISSDGLDWLENSQIVRILKGIGTTIQFCDTEPGQRYFTVNYQDIIGRWAR